MMFWSRKAAKRIIKVACGNSVIAVGVSEGIIKVNTESLHGLEETVDKTERAVQYPRTSEVQVHISPRFLPKMYDEKETIDNVPQKREGDKRPAWMSILPSMTMVLPMMLGYSLMGSNMQMGMVISGGSAFLGVFWGVINYRFAKKEIREAEQKRLKKYEEYLVHTREELIQLKVV